MPIPGYDIDDLDDDLRERIEEKKLDDLLTDEDRQRLKDGESLLDILSEEDIQRLLTDDD
ncbi:hypothetical protein [Haloarchaeobius sp. HME9146]|uniref:hypothetical protein n=1 Tax=Haloarchaeobius sp. HME9146 TaxID=2978732 RepID=UPI0021C074EB|nr:hypothetical protein [Haloarchaeobius sp. HME9146]MCT9094936.1 hypothetical protein [Haloarchaeobius sp. HME9146]